MGEFREAAPRKERGRSRSQERGKGELAPGGFQGAGRPRKTMCSSRGGPRSAGRGEPAGHAGARAREGATSGVSRGAIPGPEFGPRSAAVRGGELWEAWCAGWCRARGSRRRGPGRANRQNLGARDFLGEASFGSSRLVFLNGLSQRRKPGSWPARTARALGGSRATPRLPRGFGERRTG